MSQIQSFEHHTKFVPAFHFFVLPVLLINAIWSISGAVHSFSAGSVRSMFVAVALFVLAGTGRTAALAVQDRLIRLEMRLRMQQVLPVDMRPQIPDFTVSQLVALRFASDAELPELSRKVLQDKVTERKAIKKMIRDWQADLLRA